MECPAGRAGQSLLDWSSDLRKSGQEDWETATADMSNAGKFWAGVAKTGADVGADLVENIILPGSGTMRMYLGAGGSAALDQMEKENNDPDSLAIATVKSMANAWLSNKLVGGLEPVYGKSVFGGSLKRIVKNASPEVQAVVSPLLNTEGVEEGLENILNWAGDIILGLDSGKPLLGRRGDRAAKLDV